MKLYFVRHGENQANLDRIFSYKVVDFPLDQKGVEQAQSLGKWLKDHQIRKIYASPLKRTAETALILAGLLEIPEISILEELRELDVGMLDGRKDQADWDTHDEIIRRWREGDPAARFEGGEDHHTLKARLNTAVSRILKENSGLGVEEGVVIVGHGGIFNFGLPYICEDLAPELASGSLQNTAICTFEAINNTLSFTAWGIIPHLVGE